MGGIEGYWLVLFLFSLRLRLSGGRHEDQHGGETDATLIERARGGDLPAFNQLVQRHERAVFNVALRYMRSREQAEDVTQEAFLRAWRSLDSFRNDAGEGFRAWILRIAANRALDVLRSRARRPADSLDQRIDNEDTTWEPEGSDEAPLDFAVRGDLGSRLEHALGQLHPDQRLVVILSDIHGHAYDEIAEIANVPIGTVKSRINRGRARLRAILLADSESRELLGVHARLESGDGNA